MATETDICNRALTRIGAARITDIGDNNPSANNCRQVYDGVRDTVLRAHDWNFARKRKILAVISGEDYSGWNYAYEYPDDCIKIVEVYNESTADGYVGGRVIDGEYFASVVDVRGDEIPYEVCANSALNKRRILTNQEDAELIYTARVENPTLYDSQFVDAMAWLLAADLCMPLKGDPNLANQIMQRYTFSLSQAETQDAREEETKEPNVSSYESARM